ncbi:VaFE repeat-containing surface-anchored protein [Lactococcus lactis]|uniref:VaFE repeat-containing surface-anchored protein n=1 Tax=Lactococcus lactis TaxID=1358 RepID=UPI003D1038BF
MKKRNLEQDCSVTKISRFRMKKSKKFWITSSVVLGFIAVSLGLMSIVPAENIVYAAPPDSGSVIPTLGKPIAHVTLSNGTSETIAYLELNDGTPVYCLNPAVPIPDGGTSAQQDKMNAIWQKMTSEQQGLVNNIAYLATSQGAASNWTLYAGARVAVWEAIANVTGKGVTSIDDAPNATSVQAIRNYADNLTSQAKKMALKPSFDGQTVKVTVGVPKTLTDSNDVLSKFKYPMDKIPNLTASITNNTLKLESNSNTKIGSNKISYSSGLSNALEPFIYSTGGDGSGEFSQPVYAGTDPTPEEFTLNVNVVLDGSLKIVKKQTDQDSHQGSGNIAGAKFDVTMYLSDGKTVDTGINGTFDTVDSNGKKTGSVQFTKGVAKDVTTGKDGTVTIKDFSPVGDIAKTKETYVPSPYTLGHTDATGTLVNDPMQGAITEDSTKGTVQLTFTDNKQVGGIKFKKSGLYNGSDLLNNGYQFKGTVMGVKDKDGNVVAQATLDDKGEGSTTDNPLSSPLVIGQTYTAFEITAGAGFANTFAPKEVTFTYQGPNQVIDWETVSGTNTEVTGDVEFEKTMQDDKDGKSSEIEGPNLSIYYDGDVKDATGKVIRKDGDLVNLKDGLKGLPIEITEGTQDEEAVPDVEGDLTIRIGKDNKWQIKHLPSANYKAVETQAGYGTSVSTKVYKFSITKQDDKTQVIEVNQDLPNQALVWNIMWTKVLESNSSLTGLNGAKFQVVAMDDNTKTAFENYGFINNGDTAISGTSEGANGFTQSGLTAFYKIPLGTQPDKDGYIARYQFKEIVTPEGTKTIVPINVDVKLNVNKDGAPESYTYKIYWSDTKQSIYEETYSTAALKDDKVLTIHPDLGLIADEFITKPAITTTAVDASDNDETLGVGMAKVKDNAKVVNVDPSTEYTLTGKAVNQSDGSPVLDKSGKQVTSSVKFTTDPRGNASVDLETPEFDTTKLQGKKVTMLETVTDKNGNETVKEDNWKNNPTQTVSVDKVSGSTQVKDCDIKIGTNVTMPDTYHYKGLVVGQKYTVKVTTASINHSDKTIPVNGQVTFTPKASEGDIDIPIIVNTMDYAGSDLTFTNEALYIGTDTSVAPIHKNNNPKDPKETVHVNKPQPHKDETNSATAGIKDDSMRNDDKDISSNFKLVGDSSKNQAVESDESYQAIVNATAKNPYVDKADNNQDFNLNTQTVKRGQKLFYVLTLDTTPYDKTSLVTTMGMEDTIDTSMLDVDVSNIKAYDASGKEVVKGGFENKLNGKTLTINMNIFKSIFVDKNGVEVSKGTEGAKEVKVVDTSKLPLGQQYKIVVPATVKSDAAADKDIVNVARQIVINASGKQLSMQTETRVNKLKVPGENLIEKVLPTTGEGKAALGISLFGIALLGLAAFLKRRSIITAYRRVIRKILK